MKLVGKSSKIWRKNCLMKLCLHKQQFQGTTNSHCRVPKNQPIERQIIDFKNRPRVDFKVDNPEVPYPSNQWPLPGRLRLDVMSLRLSSHLKTQGTVITGPQNSLGQASPLEVSKQLMPTPGRLPPLLRGNVQRTMTISMFNGRWPVVTLTLLEGDSSEPNRSLRRVHIAST